MATEQMIHAVKERLLAEWLPDKPGGLMGLVELAANVALEVVAGPGIIPVPVEQTSGVAADAFHDYSNPLPSPDDEPTHYLCPQCGTTHRRESAVGIRHAHLFYGGSPAVVHLEHCPNLADAEAVCNCNAESPSAATRAQARRDPHA